MTPTNIELVDRPWGHYETIYSDSETTVKILTVHPGQAISLQRHSERDEFWTLLDAGVCPTLRIGDEYLTMRPNVRYAVPRNTIHRIINGSMSYPVRILEVIKGRYDENDIVRVADKYNRS